MEKPEEWMPAPGWDGLYAISTYGRVKSLLRTVMRVYSDRKSNQIVIPEKILKFVYDRKGYATVVMCRGGKGKQVKVHRLVAMAFIPNPENKPTVNHKNGVKDDNHVENLEWSTHSENSQHAHDTGLCDHQGMNNTSAKFTDDVVMLIRRELHCGQTVRDLAREYGVSNSTIYHIRSRKSWSHLPNEQTGQKD